VIATTLALLTLAAPARLQVGADEFSYSLSRQTIKAGPAIVQLVNYGEDAHDLRLRRSGGTRTYRIGKVRPGGLGELEARFLPGRFTLWCSLADHRKRGMSATLVVRKP
jgi:plastocyanin